MNQLEIYLQGLADLIASLYRFIFPEYPAIGIVVFGLAFLLFLVYLIKAGFAHALKISFFTLAGLSFILLLLHHLAKILHINLSF